MFFVNVDGEGVVGEGEMDESGEMEREIVKPLRENVAENGLFGWEFGWRVEWRESWVRISSNLG